MTLRPFLRYCLVLLAAATVGACNDNFERRAAYCEDILPALEDVEPVIALIARERVIGRDAAVRITYAMGGQGYWWRETEAVCDFVTDAKLLPTNVISVELAGRRISDVKLAMVQLFWLPHEETVAEGRLRFTEKYRPDRQTE